MGAVTFSLDPRLLGALLDQLPFTTFVETGTYRGDTVRVVQGRVPRVISVESDAVLAAESATGFGDDTSICILHESGANVLAELGPKLADESVLFWLDAHWCSTPDGGAPAAAQCDLIAEIEGIGHLSSTSVVLIDDARLFLSPPPPPHDPAQWPSFHEVLNALTKVSATHEVAVVNDVIAFYPPSLADAISRFAVLHGVDWLTLAEKARGYDVLLDDNLAKERVIRGLAPALPASAASLAPWSTELTGHLWKRIAATVPATGVRRTRGAVGALLARPFALGQYEPRPPGLRLGCAAVGPRPTGLPNIAVVMPSLNQARYVESSIRSIVDQCYPCLQFVIQDGASGDGSLSVIERFRDRISSIESAPDSGQAEAINRAFERTDAEVMGWLNSDDLLMPGALDTIGGYFARHPDVDVVYGSRLIIDEAGLEVGRWVLPPTAHEYLDWADYIPQETLYWRRTLWERVGGQLDVNLTFALDWDLLLRFVDAGARFACLPHVLGAFRVHSMSKTIGSIDQVGAEEMRMIRRRRHGRDLRAQEINLALAPLYVSAWRTRVGRP